MELDWSRHLPKHVWLQIAHHCSGFGGRTLAALQSVNSGLRALLLSRRNALWERSFGARFAHSRAVVVRGCSVDDSWDRWYVSAVEHEQKRYDSELAELEKEIEMRKGHMEKIEEKAAATREQIEVRKARLKDPSPSLSDDVRTRFEADINNGDEQLQRIDEISIRVRKMLNKLEDDRFNVIQLAQAARRDDYSLQMFVADESPESRQSSWNAFRTALRKATDGNIVVLLPGIYECPENQNVLLHISAPLHVVGCCFNRSFTANAATARHAADLEASFPRDPPNVLIRSRNCKTLTWRAEGGSIRNVELLYRGETNNSALFISSGAHATLVNVGVVSSRNSVTVHDGGRITARNSRFYGSKFGAISFMESSQGQLDDCIFDGNTSGVKINGGNVRITRSSFFGNRCNGVCVAGNSQIALENCAIFENNLHGVEVMRDVPPSAISIRGCHVSGNMHGLSISQFASAVDNPPLLQRTLSEMNEVSGNRVSDIRLTLSSENESLIDVAERNQMCTFLYTGTNHYAQKQYQCFTCGLKGGFIICSVCAEMCHKGHDVQFHSEEGRAYCDDVLECPWQCCFSQTFKDQTKK